MGALVLPETSVGIAEPSITRRPAMPCTRRRASTTASGSLPMRQVPTGWKMVAPWWRQKSSNSAALAARGPGGPFPVTYGGGGGGWGGGLHFRFEIGGERGRLGNRARSLHAGHGGCAVERAGQVVRLYRGRLGGVGRADADMAARLGPQLAHRHREARIRMHLAAGHVGRERGDVKLYVGPGRRRLAVGILEGAHEAAALVDADGQRASASQQPGQAHAQAAEPAIELVVGGDGLGALVAETNLQVVLQVLADAGQFVPPRDPRALQQRARPYAR